MVAERNDDVINALNGMPEEQKLSLATRALEGIIMAVIKGAFDVLDEESFLNHATKLGNMVGRHFGELLSGKYGLKVDDAPAAMQIMDAMGVFLRPEEGSSDTLLESTRARVVKKVQKYVIFDYVKGLPGGASQALDIFFKHCYEGAVNFSGKIFSVEVAGAEGSSIITLTDPAPSTKENVDSLPPKILSMGLAEKLAEKRDCLAIVIGHLSVLLEEVLGFDRASRLVMDAVCPVGFEIGNQLKAAFALGGTNEDIYVMHFIVTNIMNIKSELLSLSEDAIVYKDTECSMSRATSSVMDYVNIPDARRRSDARFILCEGCKGFAAGFTNAVNPDWKTYCPKRLTAGDDYCLYMLSKEGKK
jgi:hypothetical protein